MMMIKKKIKLVRIDLAFIFNSSHKIIMYLNGKRSIEKYFI